MYIDMNGHVIIRPPELLARAIRSPVRLVNDVLVPGTPMAFHDHDQYCAFLDSVGNALKVNPRSIILRGSSKVGFSIAPKPGKAWGALHDGSDLDLAVVDPDYYHAIDREVRHWERQPQNLAAILQSDQMTRQLRKRQVERQFYYYRDYNLPDGLHCKQVLAECIEGTPVEETCGIVRPINIFIFRDWLCLLARYEYDLQELTEKVSCSEIPEAMLDPRPADLTGAWETWHSNGQKSWECLYRDGWPHGVWRSWYLNGQLRMQGEYLGDRAEGTRVGEWSWYTEDGTLQCRGEFRNGREHQGTFKEWHGRRQRYVQVRYNNSRRDNQSIQLL